MNLQGTQIKRIAMINSFNSRQEAVVSSFYPGIGGNKTKSQISLVVQFDRNNWIAHLHPD